MESMSLFAKKKKKLVQILKSARKQINKAK